MHSGELHEMSLGWGTNSNTAAQKTNFHVRKGPRLIQNAALFSTLVFGIGKYEESFISLFYPFLARLFRHVLHCSVALAH